jgi:hypothetical protein
MAWTSALRCLVGEVAVVPVEEGVMPQLDVVEEEVEEVPQVESEVMEVMDL